MRIRITFLFLIGIYFNSYSQADSSKKYRREWYFLWGYTKAAYGKSSIHFQNLSNKYNPATGRYDYYDFTVHNAIAHDRPGLAAIKDVINFTVPQYVYRIGCFFNRKSGIEINFDHAKYVVDDYQVVRITGQINDQLLNNDTVLDPVKFLHMEHTDGANFMMLNYVRRAIITKRKNLKVAWVFKPGAGIVIPRTMVSLFGETLNNDYKVAGWIFGVETGLRIELMQGCVFELVTKATRAQYVNAFVLGRGHGKVSHHFMTGQITATLGFILRKKKQVTT